MWTKIPGIGFKHTLSMMHNHAEHRNFFDFNLPNRERDDIKEGGGDGRSRGETEEA